MELTLNYAQRINLHALMGAQRGALDDTRAFWRMQDLVGLSEEEKQQIDYKIISAGEGFVPSWNLTKAAAAAPRGFEFTGEELARVERAVREWQPGFFAAMDRVWLEPLLEQLEQSHNGNGHKPQEAKPKVLRKAK